MAKKKTKLELTWIGKDKRPRLEPRILLEDSELSYSAKKKVTDNDIFDNMLIHGDNLLALKALEQDFTAKVRCIYIDPPFNTGQAFEHYEDGIEHSLWLSLMRDRLVILAKLLSQDGSIWVHCDDNEQAYLKVMMDEVFGRHCFVSTVVWQSRYSRSNDASLSMSHNFILVYAKDPGSWKHKRNRLKRTKEQSKQYRNPDKDPHGPWRTIPWDAPNLRPNLTYPIQTPSGQSRMPPAGRCWSSSKENWLKKVDEGLAYFGKNGTGAPSYKVYLDQAPPIVPNTWWGHDETGHNDEGKKENHILFGKGNAFATPKPERLLERIVNIATNPGDLVLDSFAGSGTTAAVAHKMGRRWITVELGEHAFTHVAKRLNQVVDGADQGGTSKATNWAGGGGFRFYNLAPSLLEEDKWGNWVINRSYNKEMLAEAVCKLEGFKYKPSDSVFWCHGESTETDFIYVTTQTLTHEQLRVISAEVGTERSLLVSCAAFDAKPEEFENLTLKKIPASVMTRCEWGKDDYSLNVATVMGQDPEPDPDPEPEPDSSPDAPKPKRRKKRGPKVQELPLFSHAAKGGDA
jgi:adenine-specific DNA-methyltransferase